MGMSFDFMKLKDEEKEAVGLLQMGTFLEYLDLMLYIHMAIFLNDLFFPPSEKGSSSFLASFAFCITFILRPIGAVIFGWIGDNIGRKTTIIITTFLMSISCLLIVSLPTYSQIGIASTWMLISIRAIQGLTSMGEIIGAEVYLTEMAKGEIRYPIVASVEVFAVLGGFVALGIAFLFTVFGSERWRLVFWAGAGIAVLGSMARTRLRESPNFLTMKNRLEKAKQAKDKEEISYITNITENDDLIPSKRVFQTFLMNTCLMFVGPSIFYLAYIYCGNFLNSTLGGTPKQVIFQNLIVVFVNLISVSISIFVSYWIDPFKILKFKIVMFLVFVLFCPYWLSNISTQFGLLIFQCTAILSCVTRFPGSPIFITHLPTLKRFTYMVWAFTLSYSFILTLTTFSIAYITNSLGHWGWWTILIPATVAFICGVYYFQRLENNTKNYQEDNQSKPLPKNRKIKKLPVSLEAI